MADPLNPVSFKKRVLCIDGEEIREGTVVTPTMLAGLEHVANRWDGAMAAEYAYAVLKGSRAAALAEVTTLRDRVTMLRLRSRKARMVIRKLRRANTAMAWLVIALDAVVAFLVGRYL